ncbi:MAG: leucyl/phenylalanyl-tRNA--protein transferase [Bacteroidales bacterium]|nr:leucyl/phenylalanyl-tRNA--protein transferase [Bacteroidales bacterium]
MAKFRFPDPETADPHGSGLVAIGGDLSVETLIDAYSHGIFPWPEEEGKPIGWYSLDPRMVVVPAMFTSSKSLRRVVKSGKFEVKVDTCFEQVVRSCAAMRREGQEGSWITNPIVEAYCNLHKEGLAHSFETYFEGELVGGLYGVSWGSIFCGESMFHTMRDASKVAFCKLVEYCLMHDIRIIDAQQPTEHLASLGGLLMERKEFLALVKRFWFPMEAGLYRGDWGSHTVVLSLGGNEGEMKETILEALRRLNGEVGQLILMSSFYESEPWGFDHPVPNFLNICAVLDTELSPNDVLEKIMQVEYDLGRRREENSEFSGNSETSGNSVPISTLNPQPSTLNHKYSSRPIDIDILFYDSKVMDEKDLAIPHPRLHQRRFVLEPLEELMPFFKHPVLKKTIVQLNDDCQDSGRVQKV